MRFTEYIAEMAKRASPEKFSELAIKKYGKDKAKSLTMPEIQALAKENDMQVPGYVIKQKVARARFDVTYGDSKEPEKKVEPKVQMPKHPELAAAEKKMAAADADKAASKKKFDEVLAKWKAIETADYQKRDGRYPKSDVPDNIDINVWDGKKITAVFHFKNTSQKSGESFVKLFMDRKDLKHGAVKSSQTGDYHDDWIEVYTSADI